MFNVRWMIRRDMPQVLAIEQMSFDFAWSENEFLNALRNRLVIGLVVECGDDVAGFVLYRLQKREIVVMNLAVHPAYAGMGAGYTLAKKLESKIGKLGREKLVALVCESNVSGLVWLRRQGWRAIDTVRHPWKETEMDGILMEFSKEKAGGSSPSMVSESWPRGVV